MEQGPTGQAEVGPPTYRVVWHAAVRDDLAKIPRSTVDSLVKATDYRLSQAPHVIGTPLRGTTNLLWRLRFGSYRIVYTVNVRAKEVWILAAQRRDIVYRDPHLSSLLKLAVVVQQR